MSIRSENTTHVDIVSPAASITLDAFADAVATAGGLEVRGLAPLEGLEVWTRNSRYRITVLDPQRCRVLIEGGAFFPVLAEATIGGASCGGSMLKVGWIIQGFCLELFYPGGRIVTTNVRRMRPLHPESELRPLLTIGAYTTGGTRFASATNRMAPAPVLPILTLLLSLLPLGGCLELFTSSAAPTSSSSTAATTYDAELAFCVRAINSYRGSVNRPALTRNDQLEAYAAQAARNDAGSRRAHSYLTATGFGNGLVRAENEVLWWPLATYGSVHKVIEGGLAEMWRAGPDGTHYRTMVGEYTEVGCGVFVSSSRDVTVVQAFR